MSYYTIILHVCCKLFNLQVVKLDVEQFVTKVWTNMFSVHDNICCLI